MGEESINPPSYHLFATHVNTRNVREASSFTSVATFPWDASSFHQLWRGRFVGHEDAYLEWTKLSKELSKCFVTGSEAGLVQLWTLDVEAKIANNVASYNPNLVRRSLDTY
jgi:hypothetical protein